MKRGAHMKELLAGVKKGHCFCGKPLPPSKIPRVMCRRKACRARYQTAYRLDYRPKTTLRRVKHVRHPHWTDRLQLVLECGHFMMVPPCHVETKQARRHCKECKVRGRARA